MSPLIWMWMKELWSGKNKKQTPQKPQVILGSHRGIVRAMWHISAIITRIVDPQGSSFLFGHWIPDVEFTKVLLDEKSRETQQTSKLMSRDLLGDSMRATVPLPFLSPELVHRPRTLSKWKWLWGKALGSEEAVRKKKWTSFGTLEIQELKDVRLWGYYISRQYFGCSFTYCYTRVLALTF